MSSRAWLWPLLLALIVPAAHAEPVYVIEQLVVGVSSSPEADSEHIGQVKSGDKLELLEREGEQAHVRLPDGKEGWIKASYVSAEEPLVNRLSERTAEVEKLRQESERLRQEGEKLKQDVNRLQSELAASRTQAATPGRATTPGAGAASSPVATRGQSATAGQAATPGPTGTSDPVEAPGAAAGADRGNGSAPPTAEPTHETVFLRQPEHSGQTSWAVLAGVAVVMLLVGFVLGWMTLDRRIRQKYGGLRIY